MKKIKTPNKAKLKIEREVLRSLQAPQLQVIEGGQNRRAPETAASGGDVCCA